MVLIGIISEKVSEQLLVLTKRTLDIAKVGDLLPYLEGELRRQAKRGQVSRTRSGN